MQCARVSEIYDLVCRGILEPSGPKLGLITEAEILLHINAVVTDFLGGGAFVRSLEIQPIIGGQNQYQEPETIVFTEAAYVRERCINEQGTFDLAQSDSNFETALPGIPTVYRQDQQMPKNLILNKTPSWDGPQVVPKQGAIFYGTLSEAEDGVSIGFTAAEPFYGVLSGDYECQAYIDGGASLAGTISHVATSDLNLMLIGPTQPMNNTYAMFDVIEQIPRSFMYYIRFGVLERIFTSNSELKDLRRAKYCAARYQRGVMIAAKLNTTWIYGQLAR